MPSVYLISGAAFFLLCVLGVILPDIPTTPFLLVCSYALARSFPALNQRLLKSRLFGEILRDWQESRGVRDDVKVGATVVVICCVLATSYFQSNRRWMLLTFGVFVPAGLAVIWCLPAIRRADRQESKSRKE